MSKILRYEDKWYKNITGWSELLLHIFVFFIKQIRQLAVEFHTPEMDIHDNYEHRCTWSTRDTLAAMLRILIDLRNSGMELFYERTNYFTQFQSGLTGIHRYCCNNLHFVNNRFDAKQWTWSWLKFHKHSRDRDTVSLEHVLMNCDFIVNWEYNKIVEFPTISFGILHLCKKKGASHNSLLEQLSTIASGNALYPIPVCE